MSVGFGVKAIQEKPCSATQCCMIMDKSLKLNGITNGAFIIGYYINLETHVENTCGKGWFLLSVQ